jgi:2-polyprenyl-3-methyl-5-hydroxy-6-metoxy-1,4-benzoquinol methylase
MDERVKLNRFNFYEIVNKPSAEVLKKYYSEKYFQQSSGNYRKEYSESEVHHKYQQAARKFRVLERMGMDRPGSLLDIGCGEGWALSFFHQQGWLVQGLDYSSDSCKMMNEEVAGKIQPGDIDDNLNLLVAENKQYDTVLLDNVLEHVLQPFELARQLLQLVSDYGFLVVEVPNDFSVLQEYLLKNEKIDQEFWVAPPDHLSYFNREGLVRMMNEAGWKELFVFCDYPIDIHLLNPETNYKADPSKGRNVHLARVELDNLLDCISLDKTIDLYEQLASLGLGRNLIAFFGKS